MSMQFEPGRRYRMPVVFGPSVSTRQMPDGAPADMTPARTTTAGVRFLTDAARLDRLLPPGFVLDGEPVVTVEFMYLHDLPFLAGRGYAIVKVDYPARFQGKRDSAKGRFLSVLWENRTDCCTMGREEVGWAKVFADIFPPAVLDGERRFLASVDGTPIVQLSLRDMVEAPPPPAPSIDGILHYYYVPKIGHPGEAAVEHAILSPVTSDGIRLKQFSTAIGTVAFPRVTFEQSPTQFMIVNALADLPQLEPRGAYLMEVEGGRTYAEQKALY